jgi:hypothetical protein
LWFARLAWIGFGPEEFSPIALRQSARLVRNRNSSARAMKSKKAAPKKRKTPGPSKAKGDGSEPKPKEFPLRCSLYLLKGQKIGTMQMQSKKELDRLNRKLDLPGEQLWLRYEMRRIIRTSLHEESGDDSPAHQAWRYCELFNQLWGWLVTMMTKARNPNTRNRAARTLGGLIHQLATRKGKKWIKDAAATNEEFKHALYPFGEGGGKPPKEDLVRWIRGEMTYEEHHWLAALKVARSVVKGRFASLEQAWANHLEWRHNLRTVYGKELVDHPFTKLSYEQLTDFQSLWHSALSTLFAADWKEEKKAGKLNVKGDQSFVKRFGDPKFNEAGYYAAERYFERWWRVKLKSQIEAEQILEEMFTTRRQRLLKQMGKVHLTGEDATIAIANEFLNGDGEDLGE